MRVLWISTKPPWPPVDGGRLAQALTVEALAREGARITVVAPSLDAAAEAPTEGDSLHSPPEGVHVLRVPARLRRRLPSLAAGLTSGRPATVARHALGAVRRRVAEELEGDSAPYDVVHVEQVHAWPQSEPASRRGVPRLLRTQNVESDLLRRVPRGVTPRWVLGREAARMERYEARVVAAADAALALTVEDAERLHELSGRDVEVLPPPFPTHLPDAGRPLEGAPALVVLGGGGWWPNREATRWLMGEVWPRLSRRLPEAVLHLFGTVAGGTRVRVHPPQADSRAAFAPGSVLLVPLLSASGLRMKILESWARGVPVVATAVAATGLGGPEGDGGSPELLVARTPEEFVQQVARVAEDAALRRQLVEAGRAALAARYAGSSVAGRLLAIYRNLGRAAG